MANQGHDHPVRSTRIDAPAARLGARFDPRDIFLFDPEQPHKSANELYAEAGGLTDPRAVNWNCPLCHRTLSYDIFQAHMTPCMKTWFKTMDITARRFAGASPVSTTIQAVTATADGVGHEGA